MKALPHIIKKEFIQIRRTRAMIGISFGMPIIQLLVLGFAVSGDVVHVPTVLVDLDNSQASRTLSGKFEHTRYLDVAFRTTDTNEADRLIVKDKAIISITIPRNFSHDITHGDRPAILVKADAQNTNVALTGAGYVRRITLSWIRDLVPTNALLPVTLVDTESRIWYNPEMKSTWFMVPGIIALLLTIVTMMLTALALVREREVGTLEQLMVTPITRTELILGKTIPFAVLGMVELALALVAARLIYAIPIEGSLVLFFTLSLLFIFSTLGLGILVSTASHTQQQALFLAWFVMIFCILMSGFMLPIENMPAFIRKLTYLDPLRYYIVITREVFLKGAGLTVLWKEALALGVFATVIITTAVVRFNRRIG